MDAVEQQRKQLTEEIQTLPANILQQISNLIERSRQKEALSEKEPSLEEGTKSTYEVLEEAGLIGCIEGPTDLSVNYKKYLIEGLEEKYGYR